MRLFTIILCLSFVSLSSCNEGGNSKIVSADTSILKGSMDGLSILELDDRMNLADSLVFVFYNDPQGKDSLRYTRFYKQYATIDSQLIRFVKHNLNASTTRYEKIKKCRSEGKIWCFNGGDVFQTVYFSSFSDDCNFLYIIKNGTFYYSDMSKQMSEKLANIRLKAIQPI